MSRSNEPGADQDKQKDSIREENMEGKCIRDTILGKHKVAFGRRVAPRLFKESPFGQKGLFDNVEYERGFGPHLFRNSLPLYFDIHL